MSSLETRKIEPQSGTTVTLGAGGDTVLVSANQLKTNTVKDAGGTTLLTSDGSGTLSSINAQFKGGLVFISTQTASSSSSVAFTSGIGTTYNEYVFIYTSIHPNTNQSRFQFQCSTDGGSNYNTQVTGTYFYWGHDEADQNSGTGGYQTSLDVNGTAMIPLSEYQGSAADSACDGILHLYNASSTTYVKNYIAENNYMHASGDSPSRPYTFNGFAAGYFNTTSAIGAISFAMNQGTFSGTIAMYGTGQ